MIYKCVKPEKYHKLWRGHGDVGEEKGKSEYVFLCTFDRCPLNPEIPQSLC